MSEIKVDTQCLRNIADSMYEISGYIHVAKNRVGDVENNISDTWKGTGQSEYVGILVKLNKKLDALTTQCNSISKKLKKEAFRVEQIEKNNIEIAKK
ncbi:MAG: WXG100 family type VII secretion target [Clostridium sp.]|nr:WXG100 family type VII secretion target [Clostridium sp.]MCM1207708.1 WXG100 family type VII secretion target [Ruminococcus sp.]